MAAEAEGDRRAASEALQAVARHLNCLGEESKSARKRALCGIQKEVTDGRLSGVALQQVFGELLKPLLRCLADPAERCRETVIQLLSHCVGGVPRPEEALPYLVPALAQRLGSSEIVESSEELRLALLQLLTLTLEVCGGKLAPYLDEMVKILQRTLLDPFPDVKKESCKCAALCARSIPEHFHIQSESLIKPLMQTISHQHSKVRVAVIQTTGTVIQYGNGKSVDDVLSHLAQRLFDDAPQVRQAVTTVVGDWLLDLRDRYSYFHKLLPLLLSSLNDEIPEIRQLAAGYWEKVGLQWQKENEEDLKDKLDFAAPCPQWYPERVDRPGLGCRELIFRNISKILPAISRDITDWVVGTRIKASQLLTVLLLHAEDHMTQHMELLLSTLYHACLDDESQVVNNCVKSAELIGIFVNPEVFLKLILSALQKSPSPSHLMVLAAVIRGCPNQMLIPHLNKIASTLSQPEVCQGSEKVQYLEQLLCCVQALIKVCQGECSEISLQLMKVLITVMAVPAGEKLEEKVREIMQLLAVVQNLGGFLDLYRQHIDQLMEWLLRTKQHWTSYSIECLQFEIIVSESGPVIGESLHHLMPILKTCLQPTQEPQMRLKIFSMLSKLLLKVNETVNSQGQFLGYVETLVKDILVPNMQWHAGRTAAAIRTIAVSCLWALLHCQILAATELLQVREVLMPQVITALDEDSKITRLMACRIINVILQICGNQFNPDNLNKLYPEFLKRLDDASDEVRIAAAKTLITWFKCITDDYERTTYKSHIEFLYQGLLIHLDDPDNSIQIAVLETLKEGSSVYPSLLEKEIEAVRHKHRTPDYCEQLLQHIKSAKDKRDADILAASKV
ncbi:dynein axonemal assembly factor 5 [Microcaecilia unicolor]|uniref:Dynein axonemal assembly factor 5 n=1 Tax=Microcaecilia unicolor TaxID=1415580 RepID=A0A6P7YYT6_9AMPH|nr:dynein assembly factor 5, axonemal [Microcaecilia unicolor]